MDRALVQCRSRWNGYVGQRYFLPAIGFIKCLPVNIRAAFIQPGQTV